MSNGTIRWLGCAAGLLIAAGCGTNPETAPGAPAVPVGIPPGGGGDGGGGSGGTTGSGHILVSPAKLNVPPDGEATLSVRVDRSGDFTETVTIHVDGAPPDVHVSAPPITGSAGTITLAADHRAAHPTPLTLSLDAGDAGSADVAMTVRGAPGTLDFSWGADGEVDTDLAPNVMAADGEGRLVIGGVGFSTAPFALERFEPDGTVDTSFGSNGVVLVQGTAQEGAAAIAALGDDSLLVAADGRGGSEVIKFHADGTIDPSWGGGGFAVTPSADHHWRTRGLRPLPAGGAVSMGTTRDDFDAQSIFVAMWDGTGMPASSFAGGQGYELLEPDGPYANGDGMALRIDAKGRIVLAGGDLDSAGGYAGGVVGRLLPDGTVDGTFGSDGWAPAPGFTEADALFLDDAGRILVAGPHWPDDTYSFTIARLDDAGALDPAFGDGGVAVLSSSGSASVHALTFDAGRPLIVGAGTTVHPQSTVPALGRVDPNGVPDATFGAGGVAFPLLDRTEALSIYVVPGEGRAIVLDQNRVLIRVWL